MCCEGKGWGEGEGGPRVYPANRLQAGRASPLLESGHRINRARQSDICHSLKLDQQSCSSSRRERQRQRVRHKETERYRERLKKRDRREKEQGVSKAMVILKTLFLLLNEGVKIEFWKDQ